MIRITYCADCGYEPQALALVQALLLEAESGFASIELVPWMDGSFEVHVDDNLVHSMERDGGFPEPRAILDVLQVRGA